MSKLSEVEFFQKVKSYSRKEISECLGGSRIPFAPTAEGEVKCICLDPAKNPLAPEKVFIGTGPGIARMTKRVVEQKGPFPTFLKQSPDAWNYLGNFQVEGFSTSSRKIDRYYENCKTPREEVTGLLSLEAC